MPQLNPAPWFGIAVFAWIVLLTIIPSKVEAHTFPYEPSPQKLSISHTSPWNWPW